VKGAFAAASVAALVLAHVAYAALPSGEQTGWEKYLARHPYDYPSRQKLVGEYRQLGDYGSAYYHAAWLAWLASREYADSDLGAGFLADREASDRAAGDHRRGAVSIVVGAVEAKRLLHRACLNGTVSQQTARLQRDIRELLARAEQVELERRRHDPVVRIALAHLALSLDDALAFDPAAEHGRARLSILRTAASRASSVSGRLPDCPGPHRLLARIRARMADLEGRRELWELALNDAERGHSLDPSDAAVVEFLWVLNLRAGNWSAAGEWRARVRATSGECFPKWTNQGVADKGKERDTEHRED
jgi:hypothetical protein